MFEPVEISAGERKKETRRGQSMRVLDMPVAEVTLWAFGIGIVMSTQFLAQPFIWRNYPLADVAGGWATIARDRLIVAGIIGGMLALVSRIRTSSLAKQIVILGSAVVIGAVLGELMLQWLMAGDDRQDALSLFGRIARWSCIGCAIAAMIYLWRSSSELTTATDRARFEEASVRKHAASIRIEVLQRQIEPHFLFNTLATIRGLQATNRDRGDQLLARLLEYMSASIGAPTDGLSTLGHEVALVLAYLDIFAIRMDGRLEIEIDVPKELEEFGFPSLLLATLAENAVKHGIFPQQGGKIAITAALNNETLTVALVDNGVGFSGPPSGSGIGLNNIAERLRLIYQSRARLDLGLNRQRGVRATITLPIDATPSPLP